MSPFGTGPVERAGAQPPLGEACAPPRTPRAAAPVTPQCGGDQSARENGRLRAAAWSATEEHLPPAQCRVSSSPRQSFCTQHLPFLSPAGDGAAPLRSFFSSITYSTLLRDHLCTLLGRAPREQGDEVNTVTATS